MTIDASSCLLRHETNGNSSAWHGEEQQNNEIVPWVQPSVQKGPIVRIPHDNISGTNRGAAQVRYSFLWLCYILPELLVKAFATEARANVSLLVNFEMRFVLRKLFRISSRTCTLRYSNRLLLLTDTLKIAKQKAQIPRMFCWRSPLYLQHNWVLHRLFDFNELICMVFCVLVAR